MQSRSTAIYQTPVLFPILDGDEDVIIVMWGLLLGWFEQEAVKAPCGRGLAPSVFPASRKSSRETIRSLSYHHIFTGQALKSTYAR